MQNATCWCKRLAQAIKLSGNCLQEHSNIYIILFYFSRKSVSGNWKANVGSALLEQVPVSEKMKRWIDDISEMFGGLEICSVEAVVGKDGKEYILEVCGSTLTLLGESQEEDRRNISDLIVQRMNAISKATLM